METSNQNINNWNDKYVNLASGLGLSIAKSERQATWNEYFVLGYLINKGLNSDEYLKKGYVENDSCAWLWTDSGLDRGEVNEAIYWLTLNGYIDQIWLDSSHLCYKVAQWVLDKVDARMVDNDLTWTRDE